VRGEGVRKGEDEDDQGDVVVDLDRLSPDQQSALTQLLDAELEKEADAHRNKKLEEERQKKILEQRKKA